MKVFNVGLDFLNFFRKKPGEPQLAPWCSLLIFKNEGKLNNFGDGGVNIFRQLNRFILGSVLNFGQSVVGDFINERMLTKVYEIE